MLADDVPLDQRVWKRTSTIVVLKALLQERVASYSNWTIVR